MVCAVVLMTRRVMSVSNAGEANDAGDKGEGALVLQSLMMALKARTGGSCG